ncbi:hybrid sensor histidine kinase/response regulato r [Desulfonema ishimotonii]|uniref:histidine kinase n=1 Tax=Desulfonema ishimotonii TaxID=45657 RepID=A0A401FZ83_9BACT|nr:ATP-binding protein [Desulfonema ishimotonii]GBC62289.1 hybrid sensor histidine kinase/response regulato r [Desulfonema ishimotonii]
MTDTPHKKNMRLLLVDDEEQFREALARRLKKRGMTPVQAANGPECLAILETHPADVIVSDVKMPGMDGIELLGLIKAQHPETEVILLTGHGNTSEGVAGIKSGAFDYLMKPLEFDHLFSKIRQACEKVDRLREQREEAEFRKNMEQQMIITERLAALGTLATGVAHEINNPLAIIRESVGWMSLMLRKEELADMPRKADFEKALDKIEKGVERARRITHQLLGFVRKNDAVSAEVHPEELIEEALRLLARETAYKEIDIDCVVDDDARTLFSDPYQIRQILLNLITNAVHATGSRGRISVRVKAAGASVQISITDTGQGIPEENLNRIFEPFFTTKCPGKGTGLGLFVSRGIVQRLGGTIFVASQLGKGTTFTISLPRSGQPLREEIESPEHTRFSILSKIKKVLQ